ncbi:tryptophan aminotransferase-related protein 4-like [Sesamum indicum]|uniref:Tryptophan aminotransferase-related protein 4-like n=1 Tax=Sesamum indicum TaxID=4182 RepID=A0A6I9UPV0_SESIN|nr:tryptophan aminotransferase-related protein 4-like [Sesamum indicum]
MMIGLCAVCLLASVALNIFLVRNFYVGDEWKKQRLSSWAEEAAAEAEAVALISCSGHGRAYLDGVVVDGKPVCECNTCYGGPHCSLFSPDCAADADGGDPLFLEPFWMQNPAGSAVLISGWHRMSYAFPGSSFISQELENHIRRVHSIAKNAVTEGKYIVYGTGSTQLLSAAVFALSMNLSSPAKIVAQAPYYPTYRVQTDFFQTAWFGFQGDASELKNTSGDGAEVIEFVTSPNNPDAQLRNGVLQGPHVKAIYDHAYYWPHYTAIPAPADEDLMIFTISKLTGHAGSRFGWALVKDKQVYENMMNYIQIAELGTSKDTQLRALQLLRAIHGQKIFHFAYKTMSNRWEKLSEIVSRSNRFTIQEIPPRFCNFFEEVRGPSPAYAWLKCEREEDSNCRAVLRAAKIIGREGSLFESDDRYVRLSLLRSQDDFDLLLRRLNDLISEEKGAQTM